MATIEVGERERAEVAGGYGLPPHFYSSGEILAAERSNLFAASWQLALHEAELPVPGCYAPARLGEFEIIVTRDLDGRIHAMRNVCLHRGATIIDCAGRGTTLTCPYHAWSYGLNGRLRAAPGFEGDPRIAGERSVLAPARVGRFGPFIFANLAPDGGELSEVIAPICDAAEPWDGLKHHETREYHYDCNWKIAIENSLECYHCPIVHSGLQSLVDLQNYACEIFEFCAIAGGTRRASVDRRARIYDAAMQADAPDLRTFFIWPNLWLLTYPGPTNLVVARWLPRGVDRSVCLRSFYFGDDFGAARRVDFIDYVELIQLQDLKICSDVHRNISTGAAGRSLLRLGGGGQTEEVIRRFQELVLGAVTAPRRRQAAA